jgi:hypothetical protein
LTDYQPGLFEVMSLTIKAASCMRKVTFCCSGVTMPGKLEFRKLTM